MTSSDVLSVLRTRYRPPEWRLFPEVRNGTGYASDRTAYADAVAMNVWPSGGLEIHGFEIKVSRADWLTEMRNPGKGIDIRRQCDRWFLVVSDLSIVKTGELPEGWGLLLVATDSVKTVTQAPLQAPQPLDRAFMASLIRAAADAQEVEERQAQKAAMLKAPLRQVVDVDGHWNRGARSCKLSCGHVVARPFGKPAPKTARCLECSQETPNA